MFVTNEKVKTMDRAFGIRQLDCSKLEAIQKNDNDVIICRHNLSHLFDAIIFLLPSFDSRPSFMSIS